MNTVQLFSLCAIFLLQHFGTNKCEKIHDPTLEPTKSFSEDVDSDIFHTELVKGHVTDRWKLINIWFHRTWDERLKIQTKYDSKYCPIYIGRWGYYYTYRCPFKSGIEDISDGDMSDLYKLSFSSTETILGKTLHDAITGDLKEKGAIEEVACANDKEIKDRIEEYFRDIHKDTVENQLGTFRREDEEYQHVMQKYCWKGFCQDKKLKPEDAEKEAKALRDINPNDDKDGFKKKLIELLDKNCEPDLKLIFEKYRNDKDGIDDAVLKAFKEDRVKRAYNRMVRYVESTCQFYADELHDAVDGHGTKSDKINRIILTRCERDLKCILKKYKDIHK